MGSHQVNGTLDELRRELVRRTAMVFVAFCAFALWVTIITNPVSFTAILFWLASLLFGWGVRRLIRREVGWLPHAFIWGINLWLLLAMLLWPAPWLPFVGVLITFVNAMIFPRAQFGLALAVLLIAFWLAAVGVRDYWLVPLALLLMMSTILAFLFVNALYTALQWYSAMHQRADELLEESRDSQARLNQTVRSLELSYDRLRRIQQELIFARQQAERSQRAKEQFAANISHELRTPLNIILGFSEVMHLKPEVYSNMQWSPTLRRDVAQIYRNSLHLMRMIDDILDLSHFELSNFTMNKEPTPLTPFLKEIMSFVEDIFRVHPARLEFHVEENLPELDIDRTRIRQVLLNLLNNARRFTQAGCVKVEAQREDQAVVINVEDTGIGISEEDLPHIFDEFYQVDYSLSRSHGGAGLGLAISKRFVEAHYGSIMVESKLGIGSKFAVHLPIRDKSLLKYDNLRHKTTHNNGKMTIRHRLLVVDPDPLVAATIDRYLEHFEVIPVAAADDLAEAVDDFHPQGIIYNVHPRHRPHHSSQDVSVPVIECSLPSSLWLIEELDIAGYLTKPVLSHQLLTALQPYEKLEYILVIDDDRGFLQLIERIIKANRKNVHIHRAYTGQEGLEMMNRKRPDLVLLDLVMPDVSGHYLLEVMKESVSLRDIPVILLTGTSTANEAVEQFSDTLTIRWPKKLYTAQVLRKLQIAVNMLELPNHLTE